MVCKANFQNKPFVNFPKNSLRLCAFFILLAVLGSPVVAQQPQYAPPPPPRKNTAVEIRIRYLLAPDISFNGFGSIPFQDSYESKGNIFLGTERSILYDDGFLSQDYIRTTLVGGGASNAERIPSPNTDSTAYFSYEDSSQVDPNDPSVLIFHRYASVGEVDEELSGKSNGSLGWEINYTKYLTNRRSLGLQVGFSFNGFDSRYNDRVDANLVVQEFRHRMAGGAEVPDLPDPIQNTDGSTTQRPYRGDIIRDDFESGDLLDWLAHENSEELIADGATIFAQADLRSSIYNVRLGPTYAAGFGNRFGMQVGAGVSALYYSGSFSAYEILLNPDNVNTPSRGLTTTEANDWQVGGYVDASAHYRINPWVSVFSGAQMQSGSTYTQENEERHANVDFGVQVFIHAGLGIRF